MISKETKCYAERGTVRLQSMRHTEFIGVRDGKAILKVEEMSILDKSDWEISHYYTTATDLPEAWLTEQLKNQ